MCANRLAEAAVPRGAAALLVSLLVAASPAPAAAGRDARASKPVRLKAFASCSSLIRYGNRHIERARPVHRVLPGTGGPAGGDETAGMAPAAAPEEAFSGTNVQEAGVDEPDLVKTDGARMFVLAAGRLHALDVAGAGPRKLGSLRLDDGWAHEMLLHGDRLLVFYAAEPRAVVQGEGTRPDHVSSYAPRAVIAEVDVSDPARMRVVRTLATDGSFLSARLRGATAHVVLSSPPPALSIPAADRARSAAARADRRLRRARSWLPRGVLENRRARTRRARALVACRSVRRAPAFSGLGMLTVLTIDLAKGLPAVDSDALMSDAQIVYASPQSLYVASQRWSPALESPEPRRLPRGVTTVVHKWDISDPARTDYRASGEVRGFLLSQWALSERAGVLRAASTSEPPWWGDTRDRGESESFVTTLQERAGRLLELGRVGGLGRGERIHAVRFIDDVGYVVTFRQTDPLYTIDLADPGSPRVLGELKILGYSAYLHPVADDLLLGVGQDATADGRTKGTQLSLFDVSDLRNPVRLHQRTLGESSSSAVEFDHRAFLWWAPAKLAVIPVYEHPEDLRRGDEPRAAAIGFRVDRETGLAEAGRVAHEDGERTVPVQRSVVVRDLLYTVSETGVKASRLDSLADAGSVAFG